MLVFAAAACSAPPAPPPDPPRPFDRQAAVNSLVRRTALADPTRIEFEWRGSEPGVRGSGRGVARLEPPANARLDLIASNGETVLVAALVGGELRIPPGYDAQLAPPPTLLWAMLGVFHQGGSLAVTGGSEEENGDTELRFLNAAGADFQLRTRAGRLVSFDRLEGGRAVETVEIEPGSDPRFPAVAQYRDLRAVRELRVVTSTVTVVDRFPPDIWNPGG